MKIYSRAYKLVKYGKGKDFYFKAIGSRITIISQKKIVFGKVEDYRGLEYKTISAIEFGKAKAEAIRLINM